MSQEEEHFCLSTESKVQRARAFLERKRALEDDARSLLAELAAVGLKLHSTGSLLTRGILYDPPIVDILLQSLECLKVDNNLDMVVRALILARKPFDGRPLIECFERHSEPTSLRWTIANTMSCAKVTGISDWLVPAIQNKDYGNDREMLTMAIVKHIACDEARKALLSVIDELPTHAAWALGRIGGEDELQALKLRLSTNQNLPRKRFESAIRQIERRLRKQAKKST